MYFVPVRKLLKILCVRGISNKRERTPLSLHECLDTVPDSRRRCSRKWILLIIMMLVCLYIAFQQKASINMYAIRQHISDRMADMFFNETKSHVVKKTNPVSDGTSEMPVGIHQSTDKHIQETEVTTMASKQKTIVVYKWADKPTSKDVDVQISTVKNLEEPRTELQQLTNGNLAMCGLISEENDEEESNEKSPPDTLFMEVKEGGYHYPKTCRSRHKVAVLVPYRNRERNLAVFLYHIHPFLIKQQLEYRIFVIEQAGTEPFNRGKLFNVGFMEMQKYNKWQCVVLHDVDLLPQNDKIMYTCPTFPRHMCGTVVEKARLTYNQYHTLFGGVSALSVRHFKQINGFSNLYWGWGGEDNDMYWRLLSARIPIVRYNKTIALYKSLPHARQSRNNQRYQLLRFTVARCKTDGLSDLVYKVIWTKYRHLYTHILANVNPSKENVTNVFGKLYG